MTNQVIVKDIGALTKFAGDLQKAKQALEQTAGQLRSAMSSVDGQWQDPQKEKCKQQIESLAKQLKAFSQQADAQISYVKRLANHLQSTPG